MKDSKHVPPGGFGHNNDLHPPPLIETNGSSMKIFKIVFRIIALPFYATVIFIALIRVFIMHVIEFVVYGGEQIAYNKKFNPDTIASLLEDCQVNNKKPFQDKVNEMTKGRKK